MLEGGNSFIKAAHVLERNAEVVPNCGIRGCQCRCAFVASNCLAKLSCLMHCPSEIVVGGSGMGFILYCLFENGERFSKSLTSHEHDAQIIARFI